MMGQRIPPLLVQDAVSDLQLFLSAILSPQLTIVLLGT